MTSVVTWNEYHKEILSSKVPMCITKIGSTEARHISSFIQNNSEAAFKNRYGLDMSCGVHCSSYDSYINWCRSYISGIKTSDFILTWHDYSYSNSTKRNHKNIQRIIQNNLTDSFICSSLKNMSMKNKIEKNFPAAVFQPFSLGKDAWHRSLHDKKILVVSNAEKSFRYQAERFDKIWHGAKLGGFEFVKIPLSENLTGNENKVEWNSKLEDAQNEISKIDFDFALVGCGGIGLVLIDFIKNQLGKSCTYLGGSLQLYFGIRGGRWENCRNDWYNDNEYWIKTFPEDIPINYKTHENGSYWTT